MILLSYFRAGGEKIDKDEVLALYDSSSRYAVSYSDGVVRVYKNEDEYEVHYNHLSYSSYHKVDFLIIYFNRHQFVNRKYQARPLLL